MSYKSLLFCPDEKTAQLVTQVLSELEFTVELQNEPFAAVKKLTDQHFDALVVDCQNEQDASLLFKGARNSNLNHSSLSVAVVEGQAGVARAFRIGANLVLTKPINIEQSKSTLRVARGLLRKNEAKAASQVTPIGGKSPSYASASAPMVSVTPSAHAPVTFAAVPDTLKAAASAAPFSALEVEKDPIPAPEPSEVALLESMPSPIDGKVASSSGAMWAPRSQGQLEPIAASTGGHGAAAAPALAKTPELKLAGASPMFTQEPIVAEAGAIEHFPVNSVPTFSSLGTHTSSSSGGKKFIGVVAIVFIAGAAGFIGWQKLQPLQYLHRSASGQTTKPSTSAPDSSTAVPAAPSSASAEPETDAVTPSAAPPDVSALPEPSNFAKPSASVHNAPETIRVQELPNSDQKTSIAPKPIVVQNKPEGVGSLKPALQPTPPALQLGAGNSDAALAKIISTDTSAPKLATGSFRISQGVSQGLVIKKVPPVYSPMALQLHKEGVIELVATISKAGAVTGVRVVSGDLMLAKLAIEAVRQWKYRPYLLNGEPVEIETQITVNFRLPR